MLNSKEPCRTLSIPYWKHKTINTPSNIMIIHNDEFYNQYIQLQQYQKIFFDCVDNTMKVM